MKLSELSSCEADLFAVEHELASPGVYADRERLKGLLARQKELRSFVDLYEKYKIAEKNRAELRTVIDDPAADEDVRRLAGEETETLLRMLDDLQAELDAMLTPNDPDADKSVIVEIRAGVGGEEAALFAADLFRMYVMFAEKKGLFVEREYAVATELGGYKEICFSVEGRGAYAAFRYESGVHRVQRVPKTETQGRIQTSAVTVAVLPEPEPLELTIGEKDVRIESCKSSGAGGQHVNKTESAVRLTHLPTGIVVECQEERSQFKNRDKAFKLLRAKLYDIKKKEQEERTAGTRREQVGTGDRSEKIRTYHYPQNRVTDHRIKLSLYALDTILDGDMQPLVTALQKNETEEKNKCRQSPAHG